MKKYLFLLSLLIISLFAKAQTDTCAISGVISTIPVFPNQNGSVTIYFDATKGNKALADYTGDIYAHTGVITTKSPSPNYWLHIVSQWGENLPKTKFERLSQNLYVLHIDNIREYYDVTDPDEKILAIAMVIRSGTTVNGDYLVARNADGSDFHIQLYDSVLNVKITRPLQQQILTDSDTVRICAFSMLADSLKLYLDSKLLLSTSAQSADTQLLASSLSEGNHQIVACAENSSGLKKFDTVTVFKLPQLHIAQMPQGLHNGVNVINDSTVTIVLWDPAALKKYVLLLGDFNNWQLSADYMMNKTPDNTHYWLTLHNLSPQKQYAYQFLIDGSLRIADPYAHMILDPWNDKYIPQYIYPNLKPYPTGKTHGIVSVFSTKKDQYDWQTKNFKPADYRHLVIYELLIRDFVKSHYIRYVAKKLDYLDSLGVNAIELMPFNEFEGNISWGYNPDFYFAVDKYYGKPDDFKYFIDQCHKRGIAVIMDIVLNHAYYQCPLVQMYWDSKNNRPSADNPWFNQTPRHPLCPGYDFNHESPATKQFVDDVLKYWLTEYHIDGFRFDLSKGFTQRYTTTISAWSAYDASRIKILSDYYNFIKSVNPRAIVILEHFAEDREEQVLAQKGFLLWSNQNYSFAQAAMGWINGSDFSREFYQQHGFTQPRALSYMESHDEERIMYKIKTWGNSYENYNTRQLPTAVKRVAMTLPFFFAAPGPKMIWQFEELGYDYSINTCENGTINDNCRTSPKPIRWDYASDSLRHWLYLQFAHYISWHVNDTMLNTAHYSYSLYYPVKVIRLDWKDQHMVIVGNFAVNEQTIKLQFPHSGLWLDQKSGRSMYLNDSLVSLRLLPGEYHVYTDKYVPIGTDTSAVGPEKLKIFPNPAHAYFVVKTIPDSKLYVYDLYGKLVKTLQTAADYTTVNALDLEPGIYFVKQVSSSGIKQGKVIVLQAQ